ncbi:MAG: type II toxin-antitoxin system RatA family toxin [Symbiobacteriia bacterium]
MPFVESSVVIKGTPQAVYALAKDMESYPEFMEDVVSIKVEERSPGRTVTAWHAKLQGKPMLWKEEDLFDDEKPHIRYQQVSGDLKKFEGDWSFDPTPDGTKVTLTVDFELGIPMFAAMLNPVAKLVVRSNVEMMLRGMKAKVEG